MAGPHGQFAMGQIESDDNWFKLTWTDVTCRLLYVGHLQQKAWRVTTKMKTIDG